VVVLNRACDEPFIFFPNAFSPNGDGENDRLRVRAKDSFIDDVYWIVYNRWGEKVFENDNNLGVPNYLERLFCLFLGVPFTCAEKAW